MAGLDMVKGPHWSQILSLFGANGSISDILKDRTQVQLKDKARNLKLFFLKTNSEMPYYLQCVTGELKTRAPGQAARKEAEEKARQNSEEEQARLQGIMTLAGGLQHNHHSVNNAMPTPSTPTPARTTPMTSYTNIASIPQGMNSPMTPHTTLAPATPSIGARGTYTPNFQPGAATQSNIGTAAPRTPSISRGTLATPNSNTGAQMVPNVGASGGRMGHSSTSVPPMSGTAVTTSASPVVVKTEPQDQPVMIQPKPAPQSVRSTEPVGTTNFIQHPQSPAHRPTEQVLITHAAPQSQIQLTFPSDTLPDAPVQSAAPANPTVPAPAPAPKSDHFQGVGQISDGHHTSVPTTTTHVHHDLAAELAQLANYQPPENHATQQQNEHHQHNLQAYGTNGVHGSNEHHENHEHHNHQDSTADMTLLQTLQAALAAAPSG